MSFPSFKFNAKFMCSVGIALFFLQLNFLCILIIVADNMSIAMDKNNCFMNISVNRTYRGIVTLSSKLQSSIDISYHSTNSDYKLLTFNMFYSTSSLISTFQVIHVFELSLT